MDSEFTNNHSGITVEYGNGTGSDRGTAFEEQYYYHDRGDLDRKIVYIRSDTPIRMYHNQFNALCRLDAPQPNPAIRYHIVVGANGLDGIPNSGDEGIIRYRVDRDGQDGKFQWVANNQPIPAFPAFTTDITFDTLMYQTGLPVLGSTGFFGNPNDRLNGFGLGSLDDTGNEWHAIYVGDDDRAAAPNNISTEQSSDGRMHVFCVNPRFPTFKILATGNAEFYCTPARRLEQQRIFEQTHYIAPRSGTISIVLRDLYGTDIQYKKGSDDWVSVGGPTVTLSGASFADGATQLLVRSVGYESRVKTHTIHKNPTSPSAAEDQAHRILTSDEYARNVARRTRTPYSAAFTRISTNTGFQGTNAYKLYGKAGYRNTLMTTTTTPPYMTSHTISQPGWAHLLTGWYLGTLNTVVPGETLTRGQFGVGMMIASPPIRLDGVGLYIGAQSNYAAPTTEIYGPGYQRYPHFVNLAIAYSIASGFYREDQYPGKGMTPIQEYLIRDGLAWSMYLNGTRISAGQGSNVGLWTCARVMWSQVIAIILKEYSTPYYGTSGYGTVQTTWNTELTLMNTYRTLYGLTPYQNGGVYPNTGYAIWDPEEDDLWQRPPLTPGVWAGPVGYFNQLQEMMAIHTYFRMRYEPSQIYPSMETGITNASQGTLVNENNQLIGYSDFAPICNAWCGSLGLAMANSMKNRNRDAAVLTNGTNPRLSDNLFHDDTYANSTPPEPTLPTFSVQPVSLIRDVGESATFTVAASGIPSPTLQWYKDGSPIGGATATTYTIPSVSEANQGNYWAVATNSVGPTASNQAYLDVVDVPPPTPTGYLRRMTRKRLLGDLI